MSQSLEFEKENEISDLINQNENDESSTGLLDSAEPSVTTSTSDDQNELKFRGNNNNISTTVKSTSALPPIQPQMNGTAKYHRGGGNNNGNQKISPPLQPHNHLITPPPSPSTRLLSDRITEEDQSIGSTATTSAASDTSTNPSISSSSTSNSIAPAASSSSSPPTSDDENKKDPSSSTTSNLTSFSLNDSSVTASSTTSSTDPKPLDSPNQSSTKLLSPTLLESPGKKKFVSNNLSVGVLSKEKINLLLMILKQKNHIQSIDQKISIYLSLEELIALILEELEKRKIPLSKSGVRLVGSTASNIIAHTKADKHYDFNDIDLNFYLLKATNFTNLLDLEETVIAREVYRQTGIVVSKKEVFNNFFRERVKVLNFASSLVPRPSNNNSSNSSNVTPSAAASNFNNIISGNGFSINGSTPATPNMLPLPGIDSVSPSLPPLPLPSPNILNGSSGGYLPHPTSLSTPTTPILIPSTPLPGGSLSTPTTPTGIGMIPTLQTEVLDDWSLISLGCDGETPRNIDIKFIRKISRAYAFSLDSFHIILDPFVENYHSLLPHNNNSNSNYKDINIPFDNNSSPNSNSANKSRSSSLNTNSMYITNNQDSNNQKKEENNNISVISTIERVVEINNDKSQSLTTTTATSNDKIINVESESTSESLQSNSSPLVSPPSLLSTSSNSIDNQTSNSTSTGNSSTNSNETSPQSLLSPQTSIKPFSLNNINNNQDDNIQPLSLDSSNNPQTTSSQKSNYKNHFKKHSNGKLQNNEEFPPLIIGGVNKSTLDQQNHQQQNSWNQNLALKLNNQSEEKKRISDQSKSNHLNDKLNEESNKKDSSSTTSTGKKKKIGHQNQNHNQKSRQNESYQLPPNLRVKVISIYGNYSKAKMDLELGRLNSCDPKQIRRGIFRYCHELAKGRSSGESTYFDRVFRESFFTQDLMKPSEFQTTLLKYIKKHKNLALLFLQFLENLLIQPYRMPPILPSPLIPITSTSLLPIPQSLSIHSPGSMVNTNNNSNLIPNSTSSTTTPSSSTPSSPIIDSDSQKTFSSSSPKDIIPPSPKDHYHNIHRGDHHISSSPQLLAPSVGGLLISGGVPNGSDLQLSSSPSHHSHHHGPLPHLNHHHHHHLSPSFTPHSPKSMLSHSPKTHSQPTIFDVFYLEYLNIIAYLRSKLKNGDIDSLWEKKMI